MLFTVLLVMMSVWYWPGKHWSSPQSVLKQLLYSSYVPVVSASMPVQPGVQYFWVFCLLVYCTRAGGGGGVRAGPV